MRHWLLSGLLLCVSVGCSSPAEPSASQERQIQPDPWVTSVDLEYMGPPSVELELRPNQIAVVGWFAKQNTCLSMFPLAYLRPGRLRVELTYPPKGFDCQPSEAWIQFEAGFAVPGGRTYRVTVDDRSSSPSRVIDREVFVPAR